jgi:uncharacterized membrane protein
MLRLVRTTLIGGVVFLIPVVVVGVVVGQAVGWIRRLTDPVVTAMPRVVDHVVLAFVVAILVLLVVCFLAGLVARTERAQALVRRLESRILTRIPFYTVLKTRAEALLQAEQVGALRPVVVRLDDAWQLAFEVERLEEGLVAVFVPGAPDPWAGDLLIVEPSRVSKLDVSIPIVERLCHRLGKGAEEALGAHFREARASGS